MQLCEHLLKMQYWESERDRGLRGLKPEIRNFHFKVQAISEDSSSLRTDLAEKFSSACQNGRKLFLDQSDLEPGLIPEVTRCATYIL
jgi:Domain of unknown function DUF29